MQAALISRGVPQAFNEPIQLLGLRMPASAFWRSLGELRERFQQLGSTQQARIDLLVESARGTPPTGQREMMRHLNDVADNTDHVRCLLQAILPPDVTEYRGQA
jgi:hypothetical protein